MVSSYRPRIIHSLGKAQARVLGPLLAKLVLLHFPVAENAGSSEAAWLYPKSSQDGTFQSERRIRGPYTIFYLRTSEWNHVNMCFLEKYVN